MESDPQSRQDKGAAPKFRSFHDVLEEISQQEDAELDRLQNLERLMQDEETPEATNDTHE